MTGGVIMPISVRLSPKELQLIKRYAELQGVSISDLIRQTLFEKIEDDVDIILYEKARKAFNKHPKTISMDDVLAMFEIDT
jgi:RHH-type transcriptional regulator, rel operon repressor / antitoxin RelB